MTTMISFRHFHYEQPNTNNRDAFVLLLAASLLMALFWAGSVSAKDELPRVGILSFANVADEPRLLAVLKALKQTLADQGWVEGKNVSFEYRSALSDPTKFARAASALVELDVDVIVAGSAPALRAAYAATRTIPIVAGDFTTDPVSAGYIENHARPGGNVTGVFLDAPEIAGKWFELLTATIPDLSRVSVLWDPGPGAVHLQAVRNVAASLSIDLQVLEVHKPGDIDKAFNSLSGPPQAVVMLPSPLIYGQSTRLAHLTLEHRLPATSMARGFAIAGGMISYGPEVMSAWHRMGALVSKVLDGNSPAVLPVAGPSNIQLVVNLKSAKALDITIPQSILLRADEVIR